MKPSLSLVLAGLALVLATEARSGPAAVDAVAHRKAAEVAAGPQWARAYGYLCEGKDKKFNSERDPAITPRWLFDDLGVLGDRGTLSFVIKTKSGVVLIDGGYPSKTATVLEPGLKALGVQPGSVKAALVTHGHSDHFGGALYLQKTYGTQVWASELDWPALEQAGGLRDKVVMDGGRVSIDGLRIGTVAVPGHTPGAFGYIFPVHEGRKQHVAALLGGLMLGFERADPAMLKEYLASVERFGAAASRAGADVELASHPLFDRFDERAAMLDQRPPPSPNPFVVGAAGFRSFLTVNRECAAADLSSR